jgi:type I restriction enzyme, S subunit
MKLLSLLKELSLDPKNAEKLKGLIRKLAINGRFSQNLENWKKTPLKGLGDWAIGTGFPLVEQGLKGQEILFAKVSDMNLIGNEKCILTTNNSISFDTAKRIRAKIHSIGTVIFPKIGGAIATNKRRIIKKPTIIDNNCLGITPNDNTSVDWLLLILASIDFTEYQSGTSVPSLSQKIIGEIEVTQPPLEEQKVIVEVVNALLKEVEVLEELTKERISLKEDFVTSALRRLTETDNTTQEWNYLQQHFSSFFTEKKNIKSLRETILQLAVQGNLTAKWREANPSVEHASELLKRIEAEKQQLIAEKKIKKEKPLSPIEDEDKPYDLPEGWVWCRLGEIVSLKSGTTFNKALELDSGDYMYVKVGGMNLPGNEDIITISNLYVNSDAKIDKALIPEKSIIFPKRGGAIATNKKRIVREPILVDLNTMAITSPNEFNFMYLRHWFSSIDLWELNNGTSVPQINNKDIAPLMFSIPPLREQKAIVEKVKPLMDLCDELEQQIENSQSQIEQLMQSCLKEVFT